MRHSRIVAAIAVVVIACAGMAMAGDSPVIHPQKVLRPVAFGVTPPLASLPTLEPVNVPEGKTFEVPNHEASERPTLPGARPNPNPQGESALARVLPEAAPAPMVSFAGLNSDTNQNLFGFRVAPPDTEGAVGLNYYIQWINLAYAIYNKSDGSMAAGPYAGNTLWQAGLPGTDCANNNDGDPVVLYDHAAQRWFMSQFSVSGSAYYTCLAVSQTSDPLGSWYVWQYQYSTSVMNDYPKFGVWPDGYYMTVNEFGSGESATTVFDRTAMLAGDPNPAAQYFYIEGSQPAFPLPTNWDGGDPPPAGSPNYNIAFYDDAWGNPSDMLQICEFHVDWTTPANSTFTCPTTIDLTAAGFSFDSDLCGYSRNCIPQPNGQTVDTLADRLMFPANYRNLMATKGYEVMVVTQSVDVDGSDHAGVRWYELHNTGSGWFVYDAGTFAPDSDHRWMGSAAVDQEGNIGLIYSLSSSTTNPSVAYTGRLASDPPGTMDTETVAVAGGGSQSGVNRWGDYAALHTDPDGCTMWGTAEYVQTGGSFVWDTWVVAFSMPGCTPSGFGTVSGTVTDAGTGDPIAGAQVQIGSYTTYTQADGTYAMNVPAGTYDITVTAFGYDPATATGVNVPDGGTVTQDFALTALPTATVDGWVTGADRGWPLYAEIEVYYAGQKVATTFTDPFSGYYEITLPAPETYDFEVTSMIPHYLADSRTVPVDPAGQTESFALLPDGTEPWTSCHLLNGIDEQFEGTFPPAGWTVVDNLGNGMVWKRNDEWGAPNRTPGADGFSAAAEAYGSGQAWDTELWSPPVTLPASPALGIQFDSNFQDYAGNGDAWFEISTDGGSTWTTLWYSSVDDPSGGTTRQFDLSAYAGMTVQFRWHYVASSSTAWFWHIDDVQMYLPPPPADIAEDFESWPPTGWNIVNNGGDCVWESTATTGRGNLTGGSGEAADADADWCGGGTTMDTELISPAYDFSAQSTVWVEFKYNFAYLSGDVATFDYSTDGGTSWVNVLTMTADQSGTFHQDMSADLAGQPNVMFRWTYYAPGWNWYYEVDEFRVWFSDPAGGGTPPPVSLICDPVPGTLIEGFVSDANTTLALVGAQVADDLGHTATTVATPDDPAQPDGWYWMFTPLPLGPSTRTYTASMDGYASSQVQLNPVPDTVNRIDFALDAGWLEVSPLVLESRLSSGQNEHQTLTFLNHGGVDANVSMFPVQLQNSWPHASPVVEHGSQPAGGPASIGRAPRINGAVTGARGAAAPLAGPPAYAVDIYPGDNLVHWADVTDVANWTVVGSVAGTSYFAGDFLLGDFSTLYVLDYSANTFEAVDTATGSATVIGNAVPGGGETWSGLTAAVDGTLYASATTCSSSTLYTINPADGSATPIGPITNGACIIDIAIAPTGELYGVDIVSDSLIQIDPASGAGTVIGPLGIDANYAQGMDFDELTGTLYWAAYNSGAGQGELRVIDPATGASTLVGAFPGGAEVDALAIQTFAGGGLPWLVLTPDSGTVPAGGQLDVDAEFIADGAPHWGLVRADVMISHDTPYTVPDVRACLTKAFNDVPQGYWADAFIHAMAGAGISQGCGMGNFCPDDPLTRGVMARWLLIARYGPTYSPPPCTGIFQDVVCESTPNADWIEALYNEGITAGCNADPLLYCPDDPVTRAQMAVFLLVAKEGTGYTPPACTGIFSDVPCPGHWAADWVEELYNRGITAGCSTDRYCPDASTTRAQMAVFMTVNWGFPMCQ